MKNALACLVLLLLLLPATLLAQEGKVLDRLPYEVIMDIVWRGKEIQIRKVLACDLRRRLHPGNITSVDPGLKLRNVWDQSVDRTYHVLPSGEVLIIELPHRCNTFNKWLDPLPDGYLPITYWVDSADSPQVAEDIQSYRYYTDNPRRRFEMRRFRQVEAPHLAGTIDDDQRLVDLFRSTTKFNALLAGLSAVAFPQSVWERFPGLASELRKRSESGPVERSLLKKSAPLLLGFCESSAQGIGPAERCLTGPFDTRPYVIASSLEDGVWRLRFDEPGVRRYFRRTDIQILDRPGCALSIPECVVEPQTYRFEIDGKTYEFPVRQAGMFFDVRRQMLLGIGLGQRGSTFSARSGR